MGLTTSIARTGLGYILSVIDDGTAAEVVRFEVMSVTKSHWGIHARVTVRSRISTARTVSTLGNHYVTTERLDFLSGRSRLDFANRLNELIPAPPGGASVDWRAVVEDLVVKVMEAEHRAPTVTTLSSPPANYETPFLVPYLVPTRKATILYGAGGTGKSIFAAGVAAAVQTGAMFLDWPCEQANVLYLDWETDEQDISVRNALASKGLGLTKPAPVQYMALELPLETEMASIAAAVVEHSIGLVIIDSVGMASSQGRDGADPAEGAIRFFRALRMLNASVLAIDHVSGDDMRRGRSGAAKPYGSVFKWNSARNAFELMNGAEPGSTDHRLVLRHRKSNIGPRMTDVPITVTWHGLDTDGVRFHKDSRPLYEPPLVQRILNALVGGPASYRAMAEMLNAERGAMEPVNDVDVRLAARSLVTEGLIAVDSSGIMRGLGQSHEEDSPEPESYPMFDDAERFPIAPEDASLP